MSERHNRKYFRKFSAQEGGLYSFEVGYGSCPMKIWGSPPKKNGANNLAARVLFPGGPFFIKNKVEFMGFFFFLRVKSLSKPLFPAYKKKRLYPGEGAEALFFKCHVRLLGKFLFFLLGVGVYAPPPPSFCTFSGENFLKHGTQIINRL